MSRLFPIPVAFTLFAASAMAPALPAAATTAPVAACLAEAQWPVTQSPAFADGSARTRERLLNAHNPAVSRYSVLCRQIAAKPARAQANAHCQQDAVDDKTGANDATRAHLDRMAARCAALAG